MEENKILAPKLGVNDDFVTVGSWHVKTGDKIEKDQIIASIESTKEIQELLSEFDGYIKCLVDAGEEVKVGEEIAFVSDNLGILSKEATNEEVSSSNFQATKKAIELAKEHNIDLSKLGIDGIIREKDVLKSIDSDPKIEECKSNQIIIIGGSGLGKMSIDAIRSVGGYSIAGICDVAIDPGTDIMGVPVIGDDSVLDSRYEEGHKCVVNAIGSITHRNNSDLFFLRKKIYELVKNKGFFMPNVIHHNATIEQSATMGEGNLVFAGAYIGSDALIGNNCIINNGCIISHDCKIANHVRISPNTTLAGNVSIGENSLIGMGVTIYIGVKIGKNVVIANGVNVLSNVPDNSVVK